MINNNSDNMEIAKLKTHARIYLKPNEMESGEPQAKSKFIWKKSTRPISF